MVEARRWLDRALDHGLIGLVRRRLLEQPAPGQQLVRDHAEREHVGPAIDVVGDALFGRHVRELALDGARARAGLAQLGLRDPEVDDLDHALEADDQVLRRDIAVDDVERLTVRRLVVRVVQPGRGLREHVEHQWHGDLAAGQPLGGAAHDHRERQAGEELHDHEVAVLVLAQLHGLDDVRVVEAGREPGLVQEHLHEVGVVGEVIVQALHHDVLLEPRRAADPGQVDLGGTAQREQRQDLVLAEALPEERPGPRRNTGHRGR